MHLHQVLVSASPGDAITNEAFEIRQLLREFGPSDIYARYIDPRLAQDVAPVPAYEERMRRATSEDVIVFHASIGDPDVHSFLLGRPERVVLVYHNISPAQSFRDHDPQFVRLLELGREELAALRDRVALALADSTFNASELEEIGYREVEVSPLIVDFSKLTSVEPAPGMVRHIEEHVDGPSILFVGQILPHKRPDLLIQAYHALATYLMPECFVFLVGWARLPDYRLALQTFADELNLGRAWITQSLSTEELVAFYRRADLFVTMSEHEGFCAPVLEAMAFDLPVVARSYGALPETIGNAGIVLPEGDHPLLVAEAMYAALTERDLREALSVRGRARVGDFDPEITRAKFRTHVETVI